jgi:hypothetical protein
MPIPTFTSPRTGTIPILGGDSAQIYDFLSPTEQKAFFTLLDAFRAEIDAKGNDVQFLKEIGAVPVNSNATDINVAKTKANVLDVCNWQLAMCLRVCCPEKYR